MNMPILAYIVYHIALIAITVILWDFLVVNWMLFIIPGGALVSCPSAFLWAWYFGGPEPPNDELLRSGYFPCGQRLGTNRWSPLEKI